MSAKTKVILSIGCVVLLAGAVAGAYWYGNQPVKEYYPNGAVKSVSERQMYEKTGKFQLFAQDGSKIMEGMQEKGVKNGNAEIFFAGGTIGVNYQNGKLSGPVSINVKQLEVYSQAINLSIDNSVLKLSGGENFETTALIACPDDDFVINMRNFANTQNFDTFKNFFGCLNINKATYTAEGVKCAYEGGYQFPKYTVDTKSSCEVTNTEFLEGYSQGFNMMNEISASMAATNGAIELNPGKIDNVKNFKLETQYTLADNKFKFTSSTTAENAVIEQKGSLGGIDKLIEDAVEFAYSEKNENDVKKIIVSILKNMTWSDWEADINGHKRFSITGDFNFFNGFSNPYIMSYYSNNEVTTQWKFDDKGTQLTSKYPNTNIPMFSIGMSINDGFKPAYKQLVQEGLDMAMGSSAATFDPSIMLKLQKDANALIKGINSVSSVIMNPKGEKTISGSIILSKTFSLEQFMASPLQFLNFKVITYQNNQPFKVYEGNAMFGFKLNGKALPTDQYGAETEYLTETFKNSFDTAMTELENSYKELDEKGVSLLDSDIDPFLYGLYKGYTMLGQQFGLVEQDGFSYDSVGDEINEIATNIRIAFNGKPHNYQELSNSTAVKLGLVGMHDENNIPINSFLGKIALRPSSKTTSDSASGAFIVAFSGVPDENCEDYLSIDLNIGLRDKIIGIAVGNMNSAPKGFAELNKIMLDSADNAGNLDVNQGFIAVKNKQIDSLLTDENISKICSGGDKRNFIAVKYY